MPRILQAVEQPGGGTAEHVLRLTLGLVDRGHAVEVVGREKSAIRGPLDEAGVPYHALPFVGSIWAPGYDLSAIRGLRTLFKKGGFELVHAHGAKAGALSRLAGATARTPVVYSPHQFAFVANEYRDVPRGRRTVTVGVERGLGPLTARLICVSKFELDQAAKVHVVRPDRRRLVYHGVEVDVTGEPDPQMLRWRGEGLLFGAVSALRAEKGHRRLVEAAALLADTPGVRIAIVGDGPEREALARQIAELGLDERVRLFPFSGRMEPHLLALDGFVLPSNQFEVFSIGTAEAMACGLPVVASGIGGVPEVVADGESGILVPPDDAQAIAAAIEVLAGDSQRREDMGRQGQAIARERFSLERMLDEFEAIYAELT
jgi:glycosyltransferase involved in cell wall biosynthesis